MPIKLATRPRQPSQGSAESAESLMADFADHASDLSPRCMAAVRDQIQRMADEHAREK